VEETMDLVQDKLSSKRVIPLLYDTYLFVYVVCFNMLCVLWKLEGRPEGNRTRERPKWSRGWNNNTGVAVKSSLRGRGRNYTGSR
jgi:hypothetical protein